MKKYICILLSVLLVFFSFSVYVPCAADNAMQKEYTEDGSYFTTEIKDTAPSFVYIFGFATTSSDTVSVIEKLQNILQKMISFMTGYKSVSKTKYVSYYDKNGTLLWTVYLKTAFSYNGKTVKCTNASVSVSIYDRDWKTVSSAAGKSRNTAYADFTIQQSKLGVNLKTVTRHITVTCDKNGNITG